MCAEQGDAERRGRVARRAPAATGGRCQGAAFAHRVEAAAKPFDSDRLPPNQAIARAHRMFWRRSSIGSHAEPLGDLVDLGLGGEGHLRHAEAAEGAEAQLVGVGDPAVRVHVRECDRGRGSSAAQ